MSQRPRGQVTQTPQALGFLATVKVSIRPSHWGVRVEARGEYTGPNVGVTGTSGETDTKLRVCPVQRTGSISEIMRYVLTIVEQLDRAAAELVTDHPINNRLALILIDNATELILHRQCTDRLDSDSWTSRISEAHQAIAKETSREDQVGVSEELDRHIMTPKQRTQARGRYWDGMLKVLEDMGDLTSVERRFLVIVHDYRDELYHVGLSHDDIIRAIAGRYFLLCCDLFGRMGKLSVWRPAIRLGEEYTEVAKRYLSMSDRRLDDFNIDNEELAEKLRHALPDDIAGLANTLAGSGRKSIGAIVKSFEFLVQENPFGFDAEKMLEVAQFQRDLNQEFERLASDGQGVDPNHRKSYFQLEKELEATWRQRHSSLPSEKWMTRVAAVEKQTDPLIAMDLYQSLRNDMLYLEEAIQSADEDLDRWIQEQIDLARGK